MKNDMFTKFLQHFYNKFYMVDCYLLLLVDKNNFSDWFKLEHVTSYHLLLLAFIGG